jgi:hypothetical protein
MKRLTVAVVSLASVLLAFVPSAMATPTGHLDLGICSLPGSGATVTATSIDWTPPVGGGVGCTITGVGTLVNYTGGGPLVNAVTGLLKDLGPANPLPVIDFITFSGHPNLHFDLTQVGPGPSNTTCAAALNPNLPICAVFAGSPFGLTPTATGTSVTFAVSGIVRDTTGSSAWIGTFSTNFAGRTPLSIQQNILAGGSETSTYAGDFTISIIPVPEPTALSLLLTGGGLLAIPLLGWRRRKGE